VASTVQSFSDNIVILLVKVQRLNAFSLMSNELSFQIPSKNSKPRKAPVELLADMIDESEKKITFSIIRNSN
jgi:hypothetical protein